MKSLQELAQKLATTLQLLAVHPGFIDTENTDVAKDFFTGWANVNMKCITSGHEGAGGDFSFVAGQLQRLLENFPEGKTVLSIADVFPQRTESAYVFGSYLSALDRVAKTPVAD